MRWITLPPARGRLWAAVAASCLLTGAAGAQVTVRPTVFRDTMLAQVPVSGGVQAGIMAGPLNVAVDPQRLYVFAAPADAGVFCATVHSQDGRYTAEAEFILPRSADPRRVVELRTRYAQALRGYTAGELAALVHAGQCGVHAGRQLIAAWSPSARPAAAAVFLNSEASATLVIQGSRGAVCNETVSPRRTAYNLSCPLDLTGLHGDVAVVIQRNDVGEPLPPIRLIVRVP